MTRFKDLICTTLIMIHAILFSAVFQLSDAGAYPNEMTEERLWVDRAAILVDKAATGRADGKRFTIDVKAHRADLRALMQSSGKDIPQQHRQLHMSMVLLGVLLKTASGCQTGGHVVCPASLMTQLRTVLKNTYLNLDAYEEQILVVEPEGATQ